MMPSRKIQPIATIQQVKKMSSRKIQQPIATIQQVKPHLQYEEKLRQFNFFTDTATTLVARKSRLERHKPLSVKYIRNWFMNNLRNYCNTTSLHGYHYTTLPDLTLKERCFWIFILIIAVLVSIGLAMVSFLHDRKTPTLTVIESSHHPTWNIRFPAVTFCNFNKISRKKAMHLVKTLQRPANTTEQDVLKIFRLTMYFGFALNPQSVNLTLASKILELNQMTLVDLTKKLAPNCLNMVSECIWKGTKSKCKSLFQRITTIEGDCCSFNYFALEKNNFPAKFARQIPQLPYRVTNCGYASGLSITLNPLANDYFATYFSSYGFRLMLHNSRDFADENAETKVIDSARESFVRIAPEFTYAGDDVRAMDVKLRQCLFSAERKLAVMERYSLLNCMTECRIMKTMEKCGCVPQNLPNNGLYPICDIRNLKCIYANREILTTALFKSNNSNNFSNISPRREFACDCLPNCESNSYNSEITTAVISAKQQNEMNNEYHISLHVYFSDLITTSYRREVYQNWLSALASLGGLLGLIMGLSIVAAFEFVYVLIFRPIVDHVNHY